MGNTLLKGDASTVSAVLCNMPTFDNYPTFGYALRAQGLLVLEFEVT
jgi:hypothetical protein